MEIFILSQFFDSTEFLRTCPVPGTLLSSGGTTVAKLEGPCPCGADVLVVKKASNQPANQRNKTTSGGDTRDKDHTGVLFVPFLPPPQFHSSHPALLCALRGQALRIATKVPYGPLLAGLRQQETSKK